jgi:proteic killer suppression protein
MSELGKCRDRDTEHYADGLLVRRIQGIPRHCAFVALDRLDAASRLLDLRMPPGNRFEALRGDRVGQDSICINDRWRVCVEWSDEDQAAFNIGIVNDH